MVCSGQGDELAASWAWGAGPSTTFYPWRRSERRSPNPVFASGRRRSLEAGGSF
jgi:hypothetical protein